MQLYRAASVPPRVGAVLQPPVCLTCVKGPAPTQSPYYGMVVSHYQTSKQWEDEWNGDEEVTVPSVTPPPRRKKNKKGNRFYSTLFFVIHNNMKDVIFKNLFRSTFRKEEFHNR